MFRVFDEAEDLFQHTAARRRLHAPHCFPNLILQGFNTQPREGGCYGWNWTAYRVKGFNTQPREGGCK